MTTATRPISPPIPKLRDGERLSRDEFERRYETMPDARAELMDGVVYMASPVSSYHSSPHLLIGTWLGTYLAATPGVDAGDNATIRLPSVSEPQPDVYLRIKEANGGQSRIDSDGYVAGVPELLGEVAMSSLNYDQTIKKGVYQRDGVPEYILWNVEEAKINWYALHDGTYRALQIDDEGIVRSEVFPGLWLDVESMARHDLGRVLRVLNRGLEAPEHAEFVEHLRRAPSAK